MRAAASWLLTGVVLSAMLLASSNAQAGRKIIFYQSGEDIFETGPLPPPLDKDKQLLGAKAGYKCHVFGLFWAYLHIWDCKPVAVRGNQFWSGEKLEKLVAEKYPQSAMQIGLWARHGRWVLLLIVLGIVALALFRKKGGGKDDKDDEDDDD